ncbi:MAG: dipeptide epimerase [Bacteroidia bacterium]|nr:dipeptide epimerase [Bacteroidia bacterium]
MKISGVQVWKEEMPLTRPYTIAYKTTSSITNVFFQIQCDNGITGIGSSYISKAVVGFTSDEAYESIQQNKDWFIGRDVRQFQQIVHEARIFFDNNPGVLTALDLALHDAFCKFIGIPIVKYYGQKIRGLHTSITIGIKNVQETLEEAQEYYDRKFKILKVKLGNNLEEDIERLVKLRENFKDNMKIRIDANQGYSLAELIEFCDRTLDLDIELIEQPVPVKDSLSTRSLSWDIRKLIAADEYLVDAQSAMHLVQNEPACGIFNIKLMKCGGILESKAISTIAEKSNTDLMWGCNDESVISIAAGLHAALSSSNTKYIDLDGSLDLARDIAQGGFKIEEGFMTLTDTPGLGVELL